MNGRTVGYCFKQGVVNIKRNKLFSIASICTIAYWNYTFYYY